MDDKEDGRAQPEAGTSSREAGGEGLVQVTLSLEVPSGAQGTTGFLLFSNVHRERVKEALKAQLSADEKVTIAAIAKQIGMLWKQCDDEVKAAYADAAKVNKEQAQPSDTKDAKAKSENPSLPNSVVKRIIMLDADQTRVSPDAVAVTSRAAELFLEALAAKAHAEATAAARTTIAFRDVEAVLARWKPTGWTKSPFREIENIAREDVASTHAKALQTASKGTHAITSFFSRPRAEVPIPDAT